MQMQKSRKKIVSVADQSYKLIKSCRVSKPLRFLLKKHNLFLQNLLKLRKKTSPSKVGSLSTKSIEKGKRDVENIVEKQVVICNKQKSIDDTYDGMVAVEKNKFDSNTLNKQKDAPGKRTADSSDVDSNSAKISDSVEGLPATLGSDYVFMGNLRRGIDERRILSFFKDTGKVVSVRLVRSDQRICRFALVRFDSSETAQKALKRKWELINNYHVELFLVHDDIRNLDLDPRSKCYKYLFMDNLSPSVRKVDVLEFFKDTGGIEAVFFDRFGARFSCSGYVEFSTPEEAQKALKRNKEMLLGCAVELVLTSSAVASIGLHDYSWKKRGPIGRGFGPTFGGRDE